MNAELFVDPLQRLGPLAVMSHLIYVIISMTTVGLFFDGHHAAPFIEFARCTFFFFYSQNSIPLLTNTLSWAGLVQMFGINLESYIYLFLRGYFLISALGFGLISAFQTYEKSLRLKMKNA